MFPTGHTHVGHSGHRFTEGHRGKWSGRFREKKIEEKIYGNNVVEVAH